MRATRIVAAGPAIVLMIGAAPGRAAWAPEPLPSTAGALPPVRSLVAAPDGRVLALFEGFSQAEGRFTGLAVRDDAGTWSRAGDLPGVGWGGAQLVGTGASRAVVLARRVTGYARFHRARYELAWAPGRTDGTVGRLRRLARSAGAPAGAATPGGGALVAYARQGGGAVRVRERGRSGGFGPARRLGRTDDGAVAAAAGPDGTRIVLWGDGRALRARVRVAGRAWGRTERVPGTAGPPAGARIAIAPDGRVLVAWATATVREGRPVRTAVRVALRDARGRWRATRVLAAVFDEDVAPGGTAAVPLVAGGDLLVAATGATGAAPAVEVARLSPTGHVLGRTTVAPGALDDAAAGPDGRVALTWSAARAAGGGVDAFATWWTRAGGAEAPAPLTPAGEADLAGGRLVVTPAGTAVAVRGRLQDGTPALTAASG